ncbi:uncharacterized protein LOC117817585 [Notolabrus celidotus]|uniref:uncharacterized protein LOC117817585 n=1 Tax=Notolabrus celidotus TaxID=1203425 RepID=UPI0014901F8B|nr:uncharacterized protein LOC117817585 [Notolabrus celidotus]
MTQNASRWWGESPSNSSSSQCDHNMTSWEQCMDKMYTYFYLLLFIPGLLLNTIALWVLCRHISKKTKAVIFMINLAVADLAHILSLPLRIYYYFTHNWPFGQGICLFCFYLKYLNMYAAIAFLVCISIQRCVFLLNPFAARRWRRRFDLLISMAVWLVVGVACSPFIVMRTQSSNTTSSDTSPQTVNDMASSLGITTSYPYTMLYAASLSSSPSTSITSSTTVGCFKDLPMRRLPLSLSLTMMAFAELFGFLIPLACIGYSSFRIARSLNQKQNHDQQYSTTLNSSARSRLQSVTSNSGTEKHHERLTTGEKRRALRMVLSCSALFLICFAPYHINFLLYLMVSQDLVSHCGTRLAVRQFHPVSLCLASLSCCLNPLLYYFLTAEFRLHLTRRTSSFTSSLLSSPISSPTHRPPQCRMMSMESSCSDRDTCLLSSPLQLDENTPWEIEAAASLWLCTVTLPVSSQGSLSKQSTVTGPLLKMTVGNHSCDSIEVFRTYQHQVYAVVYSVILAPGLLGNVLAIWVFRVYVKETKKAVVFMMNLAVADLLQVLSLPLRIYYYLKDSWPFGHPLCMICFYLKYVNMYASIYFLVCVSVRRCELIMRPLRYNSAKRRGDWYICAFGWLLVCLGCLPFPLLRNPSSVLYNNSSDASEASTLLTRPVCFSELPMRPVGIPAAWVLLILAELLGFIIPLILVLACTCLTAGSLRQSTVGAIPDRGEKRRALRMVLSCAVVFLLCFAPYHVTMPLDFLAKANTLSSCSLRNLIQRCHPVALCLASLNCSLDPLMYYFTTDEFWRRLSKPEIPESMTFSRRLSCITGGEDREE